MIYTILERKRRVIDSLECILKSASVDCELNNKKNKDGSFICLPLKGKVGEFTYSPIFNDDLLSAPQFVQDGVNILDKVCLTTDVGAAPPAPKAYPDIFKSLKGVIYRMRPIVEDGEIVRFDMYEADQTTPTKKIPEKLLGTAGAKDGKPAAPVKLV
jgi:hypothetical protein